MILSGDHWRALLEAVESLDNIVTGLVIVPPLPAGVHVDGLRAALPELAQKLRAVIVAVDPEALR